MHITEEWCSYLLYGMSMTAEWRSSFAALSPLHDKIVSLVEVCMERSERIHRRGVLKAGVHAAGHKNSKPSVKQVNEGANFPRIKFMCTSALCTFTA